MSENEKKVEELEQEVSEASSQAPTAGASKGEPMKKVEGEIGSTYYYCFCVWLVSLVITCEKMNKQYLHYISHGIIKC